MKKTLLFLWLVISLPVSADGFEECVFSQESALDAAINQPNAVAVYHWLPDNNIINGVLKKGHLFSIQLWACEHYGRHAYMMMPYTDNIETEVVAFMKLFLADQEQLFLEKNIRQPLELSKLPIELHVASDHYDEFYLKIYSVGDRLVVEIKHYQS